MGILRNEPLTETLPPWTPFYEVELDVPPGVPTPEGKMYANSRYMVLVTRIERVEQEALIWLCIKDLWRSARHDWRDFQRIKNELLGSEAEAFEIYPAESRLVDTSNQFHIWCVEGQQLAFGYAEREFSDHVIFFLLPKGSQPIRLGPTSVVITRVINVAARAVADELSKSSIAEVQDVPALHSKEFFKFTLLHISKIGHAQIPILSTVPTPDGPFRCQRIDVAVPVRRTATIEVIALWNGNCSRLLLAQPRVSLFLVDPVSMIHHR